MSDLIHSHLSQVRDHLSARRAEIRKTHTAGGSGAQVCGELSRLVDGAVLQLVRRAVGDLSPREASQFETGMALVTLGSYGRRELAPFSDVDLLFLHQPEAGPIAEKLVSRLVRDLWDAGMELGSSMRTMAQCIALARGDVSVHTALLDSRHLVGNAGLTAVLWEEVRRLTRGGRADAFLADVLEKRTSEQRQFGASAYLLEPNLKKTKGGLRDLHLLNWAARARYRIDTIERLEQVGLLPAEDAAALTAGREFLLRVRNDLHFHSGRAQDLLTWEEQTRLAAVFGFADRPGMLAVEQFMQCYYRHASKVAEATERFARRTRQRPKWRTVLEPILTQRIEGAFLIRAGEVSIQPSARATVLSGLEGKLQLFQLAAQRGLRVADEVLEPLRSTDRLSQSDLAKGRQGLLGILSHSRGLAVLLRQLRAVGLLEKLLPEFGHARGLIQFNQFHKYTVDEHTLLCITKAESLLEDAGPAGRAFREIRHKEVLHLALLLHDLGKGLEEDHREKGRQIALATAERFALPANLADMLIFLVHRHTMMSHLAFRRDTSDPKLLAQFAREVHTPELLRMLYVLTVCGIMAVSPETWTSWKDDVLVDFYSRMMEKLSGQPPTLDLEAAVDEIRTKVKHHLGEDFEADWLDLHLAAMPTPYLLATGVEGIAGHLKQLRDLAPGDVMVTSRYNPTAHTVDYTVFTSDEVTRGVFSKIAGVLAAKGLHVLSAQISTHRDGVVVDRFEVIDRDFRDAPSEHRHREVAGTIRRVLLGRETVHDTLLTHRRIERRVVPQSTGR